MRERLENVRRFDDTHRRERIEITGRVDTVIGNQLHLEGPIATLGAVLYGLPDEVLDRVSRQDPFTAECRFDRYRDGDIVLSSCEEVN